MIIDILLIILLIFLLLSSVFWAYLLVYMLWYRVPLISTSKGVIEAALKLADLKPNQFVVELGCGWAPFLFSAAAQEPKAKFLGIEVIKIVLWWNRFKARSLPIEFKNQDFFKIDLEQADVIYCYLWDTIMADIYAQKWKELKPGARLISYDFPIKALEPNEVVKMGKSTLYLYIKK